VTEALWQSLAERISARLVEEDGAAAAVVRALDAVLQPWLTGTVSGIDLANDLGVYCRAVDMVDLPRQRDALRPVAFHEAGHTVVAFALGARIVSVTVEPSLVPRSFGLTVLAPRSREARVISELAGPIAQALGGYAASAQECERHTSSAYRDIFLDPPVLGAAEALAYLEFARQRANALVHRHWGAINRLVDVLLVTPRLEGDDLAALLAKLVPGDALAREPSSVASLTLAPPSSP
jgi:hypothetical protein